MSWVTRSYRDLHTLWYMCSPANLAVRRWWTDFCRPSLGVSGTCTGEGRFFDDEKNQTDVLGDCQETICYSHCHPKSHHHLFWVYIVSNYLLFFEQLPYHVFLVVKTIDRNTIDFGILTSSQFYCPEALVNSPFIPRNLERWENKWMAARKDGTCYTLARLVTLSTTRIDVKWHETCIFHQQLQVFMTICLVGVSGYPNGPCGTHLNTVRWGRLPHKKSRCRGSSWFESETCLFQGFPGRSNTLIYHNLPRCNLYTHWL